MRTISILLTTLILTLFGFGSDNEVTKITGQITDSEGAVIAHARILIHWDSGGSTVGLADNLGLQSDLVVFTDENGNYSASVPPGFYDLFVSSMAFTPIAAKVRVRQNANGTFNGKLRVDALVTKELGDEFSSEITTTTSDLPNVLNPSLHSSGLSLQTPQSPRHVRVPDAATAVAIARPAATKVFGKRQIDSEEPLNASLNDGVWSVYGTLCCVDRDGKPTCDGRCVGGTVLVKIRQRDGKILSITHTA
jgi:NTF2 fold immunity protein/Carboxypeptidase regulatory-like domain